MNNGIVSVCSGLLLILAITVLTGCSNEGSPARGSTAETTDDDKSLSKTYGQGERGALRTKADAARGRLWVLGLDKVRVYDTVNKRLMRTIALPNWSVARSICRPDMVLDSSGSAIISSNVHAKLWRVDADTLNLKELETRLQGREPLDIGFGALAFAADGTFLALSSPWRAL